MTHRVEMIYSDERGTWNLFVDNEWYYEGDYEQVSRMMETFCYPDEYDY